MSRFARRRDGNHAALTKAFEQLGCGVVDLSHAGIPGWPDVVVGCLGHNHLVEFKDLSTAYGRAGLNDNQKAFAGEWRGGSVYVVATVEHVHFLVNNWRRRGATPHTMQGSGRHG